MNLFKKEIVIVGGFRFNIGDEIWFLNRNAIKSVRVEGRAWSEGATSDWWDDHEGATYFGGGFEVRGGLAYASKAELLSQL